MTNTRKKTVVNRYHKPPKKVRRNWYPVVTVVLFFIGTILLAYYGKHTKVTPQVTEKKIETPIVSPKFDFYTLLPQKSAVKDSQYELEVATAEDPDDIKSLRNKLELLGYNAKIVNFKVEDGLQLYRLILGRYDSKIAAQQDLSNLKKHNVTSKIKRINS